MTIEVAWVGAVSTTTAVVKARSDQASATLTGSPGSLNVAGVEGNDDVYTFELSGLTAGTAYSITVDDGAGTWDATFTTFPSGAASFTFAVGGDSGHSGGGFDVSGVSPNAPTWDSIAEDSPLFFMDLGDLHYRDISTDTVASFRQAYRDVLVGKCGTMCESVPWVYCWDDHDFGANDSDGTSASKPAAAQAYRDYVPHYTLDDATGIWQTFVCGRVRFIVTDSRSGRDPRTDTDDATKTLLGSTQKAWLFNLLETATEPFLVLALPNPWIKTATANADDWSGYTTERQEIAEKLEDEGWSRKVLIVSADAHMLAIDDGTNSQYDPASPSDGPPVFQTGGIDAGHVTIGGPYSEGTATASNQQYGLVQISDDGTDIDVTLTGVSVDGTTETVSVAYSFRAGETTTLPLMPPFDDAAFLWDPAIAETKSHDLVDDVDSSNATDGDTGSDGDGDFRLYDAVGKFARFSSRLPGGSSTGDVTYMAALKLPTTGTNYVVGHYNTGNDNAYEQLLTSSTTFGMQAREGATPVTSTGGTANADEFRVLVGTMERTGAAEGLVIWVDGTEFAPAASGATPPINALTVGRLDRPTPLASNDLQVYAAAFWNRKLSDAEIAEVTASPQAYLSPTPSAPTNPAATALSATVIRVTWDNVADETGYRVERSLNGSSGWTDVSGNLAADTTQYDDTGLTAETQYFYRIFAFNANGDSPASSTVNATTDAASGNRMGGTGAIRRSPRTPR